MKDSDRYIVEAEQMHSDILRRRVDQFFFYYYTIAREAYLDFMRSHFPNVKVNSHCLSL